MKRCLDFIRTRGKPAFLEVHVDEDVMQESWPTICATMSCGWVKWNELSDHAREIIRSWSKVISGLTRGWARKDRFEAPEWTYDPKMFV